MRSALPTFHHSSGSFPLSWCLPRLRDLPYPGLPRDRIAAKQPSSHASHAVMSYEEVACGCFWARLHYCTRVVGVSTSLVVWGVGADMVYHRHTLGIYTVLFAVILFFLETTWAVTLFLRVCVRNEGSGVLRCWAGVLWLDTWKKTLIYWAAGGVFLAFPHRLWLTPVAGGLLLTLGLLHLVLLYRRRLDTKEALLEAREESYESPDRYEEELDTSPPEGVNTHTDSDTASTHEYILQV